MTAQVLTGPMLQMGLDAMSMAPMQGMPMQGMPMQGMPMQSSYTADMDEGLRAPMQLPQLPITAGEPPAEWRDKTTVMMRNLPNKYTQRMLLTEINNSGFLGTFDFLYLPVDLETNANKGYAFLNFVDPSFAWMFRMSNDGRKMNHFNSNKVVSVTPAALQGLEANHAHYANSRVNRGDPACRPLFLREPEKPVQFDRRRGPAKGRLPRAAEEPRGPVDQSEAGTRPNVGSAKPVARFCHSCGTKIQPEFRFCSECGADLQM